MTDMPISGVAQNVRLVEQLGCQRLLLPQLLPGRWFGNLGFSQRQHSENRSFPDV